MPEADRRALLRAATATLPGDTPRLDAELLLAHALGESRLAMLAGTRPVPADAAAAFEHLLALRRQHVPIAHIVGSREFWSLPIRVTADTLIPRPDSETLIEQALAECASPPADILDLGTGSGALLLAALSEWPQARGLGIDQSAAALAVATQNAGALGLAGRATFRQGDWEKGLTQRFDLILCNPPYIPRGTPLMPDVALHEPPAALFGGADGLDPYRHLLPRLPALLSENGVAIFEFGEGQAAALAAIAGEAGLSTRIANDLENRPRAAIFRMAKPLGNGRSSV